MRKIIKIFVPVFTLLLGFVSGIIITEKSNEKETELKNTDSNYYENLNINYLGTDDYEIAMTYYNGKYRTYDLNDWHLISKQTADEIQNDGSYTFESCGDYVFVFDDNSGNLLNTIDVN